MGYDRIVYIRYHFSCGLDRKDACWLSFTPSQVVSDIIYSLLIYAISWRYDSIHMFVGGTKTWHFLHMSSSSFATWRNCWASMCHWCWHLVRSDAFVHCFVLWSGFTCSDASGCSSPGGCEEWRRSQGPNRSHVDDFCSYSSVVHVSFLLRSTLLLLDFHLYSCFRTTACSMRQKLHKVEPFKIIL